MPRVQLPLSSVVVAVRPLPAATVACALPVRGLLIAAWAFTPVAG